MKKLDQQYKERLRNAGKFTFIEMEKEKERERETVLASIEREDD